MALEISAATPLYIQLKAVLLREIESGKFCCGYTDSYRTAVEREIWGQPYHGAPCGDGFSAGRLSGAPTGKGDVCSQAQNKPQAGIFNEFYRKLPGLRIKAVYKSA